VNNARGAGCRTALLFTAALGLLACAERAAAQDAPPRRLRIGYQKYGALVLLKARGALERRLEPFKVEVKWTEFPGGPALLEALNVGSIEFGQVGEAPHIFAQAAGADLVYVANEPAEPAGEAILVPKDYQELYNTTNRLLDDVGYRLSVWLTDRGHPAFFLPRDGYGSLEVLLQKPFAGFSHVMSAKYAGLGTIGLSHNIITPEYGPRLRLASLFTTAEIPGAPVRTEDLCNGCRVCERLCPVNALEHRDDVLIGNFDKAACTRHHITLRGEQHWPCGICVKVCPIGEDRKVYGSYTTGEYLREKSAIEANPDDPRYRGLVHLRRHGSSGGRIA
jgi:epoxyqueuosine reductase